MLHRATFLIRPGEENPSPPLPKGEFGKRCQAVVLGYATLAQPTQVTFRQRTEAQPLGGW